VDCEFLVDVQEDGNMRAPHKKLSFRAESIKVKRSCMSHFSSGAKAAAVRSKSSKNMSEELSVGKPVVNVEPSIPIRCKRGSTKDGTMFKRAQSKVLGFQPRYFVLKSDKTNHIKLKYFETKASSKADKQHGAYGIPMECQYFCHIPLSDIEAGVADSVTDNEMRLYCKDHKGSMQIFDLRAKDKEVLAEWMAVLNTEYKGFDGGPYDWGTVADPTSPKSGPDESKMRARATSTVSDKVSVMVKKGNKRNGILLKKSPKRILGWQERWVELNLDVLTYYEKKEQVGKRERQEKMGGEVESSLKNFGKPHKVLYFRNLQDDPTKFEFEVDTVEQETGRERVFHLRAKTAEDKSAWLKSLNFGYTDDSAASGSTGGFSLNKSEKGGLSDLLERDRQKGLDDLFNGLVNGPGLDDERIEDPGTKNFGLKSSANKKKQEEEAAAAAEKEKEKEKAQAKAKATAKANAKAKAKAEAEAIAKKAAAAAAKPKEKPPPPAPRAVKKKPLSRAEQKAKEKKDKADAKAAKKADKKRR